MLFMQTQSHEQWRLLLLNLISSMPERLKAVDVNKVDVSDNWHSDDTLA